MGRRLAQFTITEQLIRQALALPDEAKIYNITRHDTIPDVFVFVVEHPDFAEIGEACLPPEVSVIFETDESKRPDTWIKVTFNETRERGL